MIYFSQKKRALKCKGMKNEGPREPPGGTVVTWQVHDQSLSLATVLGTVWGAGQPPTTSISTENSTQRCLEPDAFAPTLNSTESICNQRDV